MSVEPTPIEPTAEPTPVAPLVPTAELRALLERTGTLFTKDANEPGHLSDRWRREIVAILDALDGGVQPTPQTPSEEVEALRTAVRDVLLGNIEKKFVHAVWLITEAMPRMRTLNNAMSEIWLPVAEAFLADGSTIRY